ncbi:hypothetical protein ABD91_20330 [Lysinibacillus sphaericus]|uniref:CHC2 zinc finger domain-containing protein n=1 Tax=Lysinibacillus sphaericus TaxID=1421 RepID=UPI0018CE536D|nr:CHC2 zinc finger domain-containing protein [Lysinibacillus sphaericus]MBG9693097.1 hypothetical protein [Lysinibacillus sphaericus]
MDKYQFTDELISNCRSSVPVSSVVENYEETRRNGGNVLAICPFHADERFGSFVATDSKGIFKCFSCGTGGDVIKFVALKENLDYIAAAYKIGLDYGLISQSDYDTFFSKRRYKPDDAMRFQKRSEKLDRKHENNIANNEILNKVFRIFIKECSLTDAHKKHLLEERQLTEKQIEDGLYFTFPTRYVTKSFVAKIRNHFGSDKVLEGIPGFYWSGEEAKWLFPKMKGMGIPILNAKREVVGIQVRRDDVENADGGKSRRYVWFSSSFAQAHEKYEHGTSSGAPVDVVIPDTITNNSVIVTEGRFKAQILAKSTGSVVLSVQGVGSWKGIMQELLDLSYNPAVNECYVRDIFHPAIILTAFDADISKNIQVFEQLKRMSDALQERKYPTYYLYWDEELGKGADDVIINGYKSAIKRYDKSLWDKRFEKMVQDIMSSEKITKRDDLKKVKKEIVFKHFENNFSTFEALEPRMLSDFHKRMLEVAV